MDNRKEKSEGCLLGLAIGDALGAPLEFLDRNSFEPIQDMISGGVHDVEKGEWTDDTSMALCLGLSLFKRKRFDAYDQIENYKNWYRNGFLSSRGYCFDIGNATLNAILSHESKGTILAGYGNNKKEAGNGSLMRIAPIAIAYQYNIEKAVEYAYLSSMVTHGKLASDACAYFVKLLVGIFSGLTKEELFSETFLKEKPKILQDNAQLINIQEGTYKNKKISEIQSSGFVLDTLEAALWSFYTTDTFEECLLRAVNLGDDADTVGAVAGQIAGAFYGINSIPKKWINTLKHSIIDMKKLSHELLNCSRTVSSFLE